MLVGLGSLPSPCSFRCCEEAETEDMAESMEDVRGISFCRDGTELKPAVGLELRVLLSAVVLVIDSGDRVRFTASSSPASESSRSDALPLPVLAIVDR